MRGVPWLALVVLWLVACAHKPQGPVAPPPPLHEAQTRALFDPLAQVEGRPPTQGAEPLEVLDLQPRGRSRGETIRLRFSRAVAAKLDLPPVALSVERQGADGRWTDVVGRTSWTRNDRLEFAPRDRLRPAHRYRVRLDGEVGGISDMRWEFETPRPTVTAVDPGEPLDPRDPILLWSDQPTRPDDLRPHLRVAHNGRPLPVRVREADAALREAWDYEAEPEWTLLAVHPAKRWPRGKELDVSIAAGFHTASGVLGLGEPFATTVTTRPPFRVVGLRCPERAGSTCPLGPITVAFTTTPYDTEGIRMIPEPEGFDVFDADDGELEFYGEFEPGKRYEIVLPPRLVDEYGARLQGRRRIGVRFSTVPASGEASLSLSAESGIFARAEDARIGVLAHRVVEAKVRVAVLDPEAALPYLQHSVWGLPWPEGGRQSATLHRLAQQPGRDHAALPLDLSTWAKPGDTVLVEVTSEALAPRTTGDHPSPVRGVFRITGLAVWTHSGPARGIVRVTDLATGSPQAGVAVAVHGNAKARALGKTDRNGVVALPGAVDLAQKAAVVARSASDAVAVPLEAYHWPDHRGPIVSSHPIPGYRYRRARRHEPAPPPKPLRRGERGLVAIAVGRGIYLPGDAVHIAGWAGISTPHGDHNTRRIAKGTPVELTLRLGRTEVAAGRTRVNAHGRFAKTLSIPEGARVGSYRIEAKLLEATANTGFLVAEPRLPTFELRAEAKPQELERGEPIRIRGRAKHLSGEAAPMHRLQWVLDCSASSPHIADLPEGFSVRTDEWAGWTERGNVQTRKRSAVDFEIKTGQLDHSSGRSCRIALAAQDASNQPVGADTRVFVHPGPGYVAAALGEFEAGERGTIQAITVDKRGRRIAADRVRIEIHRELEVDRKLLKACNAGALARNAVARCRTPRLNAGDYHVRISAEVQGKPLELERAFTVHPPPPKPPKPAKVAKRPVIRRPTPPLPPPFEVDAPDEAKAGEPIPVTISGPWKTAKGVLFVEQTGLRAAVPFALRDGTATVQVKGRRGAGPRLELTARVARPAEGADQPRIEMAAATVALEDRGRLDVEVRGPKRVRPGTKTKLTVVVRDARGEPTSARVALWVVDDALHQLRRPGRPMFGSIFNPDRPYEHTITDPHLDLLEPFSTFEFLHRSKRVPRIRSARASIKGALDVEVRRRFKAVPLFVGDVGTGPDGEVEVPLQLADDITRFRVTAIASAELGPTARTGPARFGVGAQTLEVSTPLNVRAVLPRVLRPGDAAELAAMVTIPADGVLEVRARSRGDNVTLRGPATRKQRVTKGEVVRVPFAVRAGDPGDVDIELHASLRSGARRHVRGGVVRPLRVEVERTAVERAAVYGSVAGDRPIAVPVALPPGKHGTLDVTLTSTALGDLRDAADYLADYPYGCVEQTASRLVPLIALRGLGSRVPDGDAAVSEAIAHLRSMQLPSGRFAYWPGSREPSAFGTAYASWILLRARTAGHVVPKDSLDRALSTLAADATRDLPRPTYARHRALVERALAVRALAERGQVPDAAFASLWSQRDRLPVFARLLLLQALHRADPEDARIEPLLESLSAAIEQRPAVAHVVDPTEDAGRWWFAFSSATRTDALALQTLLQVAPDDPRVEKLARGLRERRRGGRWRNTQENAFALLALSQYARHREAATPNHRIEAWIGPTRVVDAKVRGFDLVQRGGAVGLAAALRTATDGKTHVVIRRRGEGRAYYRIGMAWTPARTAARSQGLALTRAAPRRVGVGDTAVIEIELSTDTPQRFIAVEVPLPAGLEAVDTSLGAGARARVAAGGEHSALLSHRELRPDRVLLFFDSLPPGSTRHTIPVVATTPGHFTLPAAVAEAMYEPETRARTRRGLVEVSP